MSNISTIFIDIGGVLLSDGWDRLSRRKAVEKFGLNLDEFEAKHAPLADVLDMGQISVSEYLDRLLFYKKQPFSKNEFWEFMKGESSANPDSLALVTNLARQGKYFLATINNESFDLNLYRIEKFKLGSFFSVFLSSCFLGLKKPDSAIFERALQITDKQPKETIFIDDREINLVAPRKLGMNTIHFENAQQLANDLQTYGIALVDIQQA